LAARYKINLNKDGDIRDAGEYYPGNYASGAAADTTDAAATRLVAICNSDPSNVKSRNPNALGLYDVSGNVAEFVYAVRWEYGGGPWHCRRMGGSSYGNPADFNVGITWGGLWYYVIHETLGFRIAKTF